MTLPCSLCIEKTWRNGCVAVTARVVPLLFAMGVLTLVLSACATSAPTGSWTHHGGARVSVEGARVTFEGLPSYDRSGSCDEPVDSISGGGSTIGGGASLDIILDDPIESSDGLTRRDNISLQALGPSWDLWREMGTGGCDTDAPILMLARDG